MTSLVARFSQNWKSKLTAILNPSAPYLKTFTVFLLILLYGYEIFNFSLSIDEEVFRHAMRPSIAQGRWAIGLITRLLPPLGDIPMISTIVFCVGLGVSAWILARLLFSNHAAQWAFAGMFVSSPIWPHIAEFNPLAWPVGVGCLLVTFSLLLVLVGNRFNYILAAGMLAFATGIYQNLLVIFVVLLCIRYLSLTLGTTSATAGTGQKFPWLSGALVTLAGLVLYVVVEKILLSVYSLNLIYVQDLIRFSDYSARPAIIISRTFWRCWSLLTGTERIYLGYGRILVLLPLLGLLIVIVRLVWPRTLTRLQRLLAAASLAAAIAFAFSPIFISAGIIHTRVLITWIPASAFLAAVVFTLKSPLTKVLYVALGAALFVSIWINVSLFHSDHIARQRDQLLAARILIRVDRLVPDPPPARIPFVVVGIPTPQDEGGFHRVQVFGNSFFEAGGGNPFRVAAYLRHLGVHSFEPRELTTVPQHREAIAAMPTWPAPDSVAFIGNLLVIKLGPLPPPK